MNVRFWFYRDAPTGSTAIGDPTTSEWKMDAIPRVGDDVTFRYNCYRVHAVRWHLDEPQDDDVTVEVVVRLIGVVAGPRRTVW